MDKDKAQQGFLTVTLFVMVFFGFYFVFNELKSKNDHQVVEGGVDIRKIEKRIDDAVNQHLRSVDTERRMRDLMVSAKNLEMTQSFKEKKATWNPSARQVQQVGIFDEDLSEGVADLSSMSVEEQLRLEMDDRKRQQNQAEMTKQQYIEAYKQNALKDGWVVEINDNLEIISAKRVNE